MKKILIIGILLAGLWGLSCEHNIPSSFSVDDSVSGVPQAPSSIKIDIGDSELLLSWSSENSTSIARYLIYRTALATDTLSLYDSSTTAQFTDTRVQNGTRFYYTISAVSSGGIEGYRSPVISAVPGLYSIVINNDNDYTNSRSVSVNPTAPSGTSYIMLSNSTDFSMSKWFNYGTSVNWQLSEGEGDKSVYAMFRDANGNQTSEQYSDMITLDTRAEIDSFYIDDTGTEFQSGDVIHFVLDAGESGGEAVVDIEGSISVVLYDNGSNGDVTAEDGIYEADYIVPPLTELSNASVVATFTDRAGNTAPANTLSYLIDIITQIETPVVSIAGIKETEIEISWVRPQVANFSQYRLYRSLSSGVDETDELITTIANVNTLAYTDTELEPSTRYYYRLYVYNQSGNSAESSVVNAITLANTDPEAVSLAMEVRDSTDFRLTWTRNDDDDFESYRIYRSTSSGVSNLPENLLVIENSQSSTSFNDTSVEIGNTYYYKVYVYDRYGAASASNEVYAPK